jgi:FkbM family methyltransferase
VLRPGDVAVDVGANCGYFTAVFAERVGVNGTVVAFEPNPKFKEHLVTLKECNRLS